MYKCTRNVYSVANTEQKKILNLKQISTYGDFLRQVQIVILNIPKKNSKEKAHIQENVF